MNHNFFIFNYFKMSVNGQTFVRRFQNVKIPWGALYVTAVK